MIWPFKGEYRIFSNSYEISIIYMGDMYLSVEAAFQVQKCPKRKGEFFFLSPSQAKKLGREVELRSDWNDVREGIMYELIRKKFSSYSELKDILLATGEEPLVEVNMWGDGTWGKVERDGKLEGENLLGEILMRVREKLREELQESPLRGNDRVNSHALPYIY